MKDLVIPLGTGSQWHNNELKYALRSYDKYFKDLGTVYIVGPSKWINEHLPWLQNVVIVDCDDPFNRNKDGNMIRKVMRVIEKYPKLTTTFVRASDDQLLLKEVGTLPPLYTYDLKSKDPAWWQRGNRWKVRLKKTMRILQVKRKPTYNYDSHIPMEVNKKKWVEIWNLFPWAKSIGYCMNTLYFNYALNKHVHFDGKKYSCESPLGHINVLSQKVRGKTYLGYNDRGLNDVLKEFIKMKFPDKCRFEEGFVEPEIVKPEPLPKGKANPNADFVQYLNENTGRYIKIDKNTGKKYYKGTSGQYKDIPIIDVD